MPQNNFEDILRGKLANYEREVPDRLWEDIDAAMQARHRRRHIHILRFATIGIAAAVCLFFAFPWMMPDSVGDGETKQMRQMMAEEKAAHETSGNIVADNTSDNHVPAESAAAALADRLPLQKNADAPAQDAATAIADNADTPLQTATADLAEKPVAAAHDANRQLGSMRQLSQSRHNGDSVTATTPPAMPETRSYTAAARHSAKPFTARKEHRGRADSAPLTASVYGFGVAGGSSSPAQMAQMSNIKATYWDNTSYVADPQLLYQKPEITADHHYPIRFGAAMRYQIAPRFGIESGVRYTILNSDFTSNNANINIKQNVGMLGIPVTLTYDILHLGAFSTYATAGGEVAKSIVAHDDSDNNLPHPWQLSVQAAVGMQYGITENIGIYIEPGIGYYFDNNSSLETYYTDHPTNFTLSFGLRLMLK